MYGVKRKVYSILRGNLKEREHLENLVIDVQVILQWISNTMAGHTLE